jgi:hypothetical protein
MAGSSAEHLLVAGMGQGSSPQVRGKREGEAVMLTGCRRGWRRGGDGRATVNYRGNDGSLLRCRMGPGSGSLVAKTSAGANGEASGAFL